jgi:hypothetical protein
MGNSRDHNWGILVIVDTVSSTTSVPSTSSERTRILEGEAGVTHMHYRVQR